MSEPNKPCIEAPMPDCRHADGHDWRGRRHLANGVFVDSCDRCEWLRVFDGRGQTMLLAYVPRDVMNPVALTHRAMQAVDGAMDMLHDMADRARKAARMARALERAFEETRAQHEAQRLHEFVVDEERRKNQR